MRPNESRGRIQWNVILAGFYGCIPALIVAFGLSFLLTKLGIGSFGGWEGIKAVGRDAIWRSALSLYMVHHISLHGVGVIGSGDAAQNIAAMVRLPLTVWASVPAFALMFGGYFSGLKTRRYGWLVVAASGLLCSFFYVFVLMCLSKIVHSGVDPSLLPEIDGTSISPPAIPFYPSLKDTMFYGIAFSSVFGALGALIAARIHSEKATHSNWWFCLKSVVLIAFIFHSLISGGFTYVIASNAAKTAQKGGKARLVEMLPTVVGLGYGFTHGFSASGELQVKANNADIKQVPFFGTANIINGIDRSDDKTKLHKKISLVPKAIGITIVLLTGLLMGYFAVKYGSRDSFLLTSLRITLLHSLMLTGIMFFSNIALIYSDSISTSKVLVGLDYSKINILMTVLLFVGAMIGSKISLTRRKFTL